MNARALAAEVLGTFTLVGLGSLSIVSAGSSNGLPPVLVVPFGFGFALLAGIAMFGHVSGAHFNPAVTLAAWFDGRLNWMSAAGYVVAQFVGAVAASLMILVVTPSGQKVVDATMTLPNTAVVTDVQAFAIEVVLATVFVAVILTVTRRAPDLAILVIPLTLVMIHFAGVPISGASVNPARSVAPAIVAGSYAHQWIYLTAPFVGSILGWLIYRFVGDAGADAEDAESEDLEYEDLEDDDEELSPAP